MRISRPPLSSISSRQVIDEADRLLTQSYADWTHRVTAAAARLPAHLAGARAHAVRGSLLDAVAVDSTTAAHLGGYDGGYGGGGSSAERYQTLLFSATLTRNPAKLGALRLRNPLFFTAGASAASAAASASAALALASDGSSSNSAAASVASVASTKSFTIAAGLREYLMVASLADKPLALLQLLQSFALGSHAVPVLIFTASVQATHRLCRLLQVLLAADGVAVAEYSSALPQAARSKVRTIGAMDMCLFCLPPSVHWGIFHPCQEEKIAAIILKPFR